MRPGARARLLRAAGIGAAAFLGIELFLMLFYGRIAATWEAPNALDAVLRDHFGTEYEVTAIGEWEPQVLFGDPYFSWKLTLPGPGLRAALAASPDFGLADDRAYYMRRAGDLFPGYPIPADARVSYVLYRGELVLGPGTPCPRNHCDIAILLRDTDAYVWISTI